MRRISAPIAVLAVALLSTGALAGEAAPAYSFKWSGYIKADFIYDQARVNSGDYVLYVLPSAGGEKNDVTSITARETRIGLDFSWHEDPYRTDAKLEFDFYALGVSPASLNSLENKSTSMLRHAYLKVTKGRWSILAGQTSDVVSPLVPKTVNYTVCWDQGNIGYRRPQLRLSTWANASDRAKVSLAVAAARTLGGDLDKDTVDDGADAPVPTFQGRLGLAMKMCDRGSFDLGVSGHYGRETHSGDVEEIESWSANADLKVTLCKNLELAGEYFMGRNLGTYYGGVGQTVNPLGEGIRAMGGWVQLSYSPAKRLWLNAGYAFDDPDDEDLAIPVGGAQERFIDRNDNIFGSVFYGITGTVQAMLEVSRMTTGYLYKVYNGAVLLADPQEFDDLRVQFALKAAIQ